MPCDKFEISFWIEEKMFFAKFDEENKVWSNDDVPCVLNPKISIAHALLRSMQLNGSKIAQVNSIGIMN